MELNVGMYVRYWCTLDRETSIGKISKIEEEKYVADRLRLDKSIYYKNAYNYTNTDKVIKASHNIIDLIEVGDYVNGFRVDEVDKAKSTIFIGNTKEVIEQALWSNDIKSIVTKEQFESIQYRIGD